MVQAIAYASLFASLAVGASAQIVAAPSVFEVASVRLNKSGIRGGSIDFPAGGERFTATNMPLGALILTAYNVTVRQLSGLDAAFSEKYDIAARSEHAVSPDVMLRMLQALLADRFKLVVRREIREVAVYALIVGNGGPKLHPSNPAEGERPSPRTPSRAGGTEPKSGHLIFKNESMPDFAWALSRTAGIGDRVVVDETGLKGNYDFELTFERYVAPSQVANAGESEMRLEGSSLFSSLQEQLGVKLVSRKAPVEFLIVDHVERPSGN